MTRDLTALRRQLDLRHACEARDDIEFGVEGVLRDRGQL